jgi:WD40 repeat protein
MRPKHRNSTLCMILVFATLLTSIAKAAVTQDTPTLPLSYTQLMIEDVLGSIAWNPVEDLIVISGMKGVYFYNSDYAFQTHLTFGDNPYVISTVWSPDGQMAASLNRDGNVYLWNARDQTISATWDTHLTIPSSIAWSPNGSKIVVGSRDGLLKFYDVEAGEDTYKSLDENFGPITQVAWHPESRLLTLGSLFSTVLWDSALKERLYVLGSEKVPSWSPDGSLLALGGVIPSDFSIPAQGVIYIWDMNTGKPQRTILLNEYGDFGFYALKWQPSGTWLAGFNADENIRIWDATNGELIVKLPGGERFTPSDMPSYDSLAWSPDGTKLADAGSDGIVNIWSVDSD